MDMPISQQPPFGFRGTGHVAAIIGAACRIELITDAARTRMAGMDPTPLTVAWR
jgi:hypothetical protein